MQEWIHGLQRFVWGPGMLVFFLAAGLRFTWQSRFFQIRRLGLWLKTTLGSLKAREKSEKKEEHSISQFQSFCTALAATLGTGNITGVATALMFGGPGAIFWLWVSAFLGMMTSYAENFLGIKYRYRDPEGRWRGGAMVYMERGLKCRPLALVFAVCCLGASFGMGNMVQGNSMAQGLWNTFHISPFVSGSICMLLVAVALTGGLKRIAAFTEKLVPVMAGAYLCGTLAVLFVFREQIPAAFFLIFKEAFRLRPAVGGLAGYGMGQAIRMGIARGIFSNEAGLGSSVMAHAHTRTDSPQVQGMWGILEIFIDSIVVCTMTALVLLVSGVYEPKTYRLQLQTGQAVTDGTTLTGMAFDTVLPWGSEFLAVAVALFAFATILGWAYFGEQTAEYLGKKKGAAWYRLAYILLTLPGCMLAPQMIWDLSDAFNGMMAIPNLLALFFLGKEIEYDR